MDIIRFDSNAETLNIGSSSKGNQPKWKQGTKWYKSDHMGYESLAEVLISRLLRKSNVGSFVNYDPIRIEYNGILYAGCVSESFQHPDEILLPLERLHRIDYGKGLSAKLTEIPDTADRIQYTAEFVEAATGIQDFGKYLTILLEIDAFFLNEDRHTNNIAVLRNTKTGRFRLCPIFDNGLSILSDINDYPPGADTYVCMDNVGAKPFSIDFEKQVDAAEELYGTQLRLSFTKEDVLSELQSMQEFYDQEILARVSIIIFEQMRKYRIYFN